MHRFRTSASPIKGLTSDILVREISAKGSSCSPNLDNDCGDSILQANGTYKVCPWSANPSPVSKVGSRGLCERRIHHASETSSRGGRTDTAVSRSGVGTMTLGQWSTDGSRSSITWYDRSKVGYLDEVNSQESDSRTSDVG
jgi:hypothetical protein